jgi:DNA-binding GntR family transcriptional regulator
MSTRTTIAAPASTRAKRVDEKTAPRSPLPSSSRRQQLVDLLREEIIVGRLAPGDQLKQDVLCRDFAVSPAPVREALRQLESEGLVQHFPNRGMFVTDMTADELVGVLLPVRLAIESYAVVKAVPKLRSERLADLESIVESMKNCALSGDLRTINELDVRFHELTVEASGSAQALQLWRAVQPRIRALIYQLAPRHRELDEIVAEHQLLLETIRTGSVAVLRRVLDDHVVGTALRLLESDAPTSGSHRSSSSATVPVR